MAISSRAVRKKKRIRTLYEVLTDAVNYYVNHGWDSEKSLLEWCRKLRVAAQRETPDDTVARKHLTNSPNAVTLNLGNDSKGNDSYTTWDSGEMAKFMLGLIADQKTRMLLLGQPLTTVILSPQRFMKALEWTGIVELTSYQRPGGGTGTVGTMVKDVADKATGDDIMFCQDDTLIGKGAGGNDLIIVTNPTIEVPEARHTINTNIFSTLVPNQQAVNVMFCDMAAPTEIPSPMPDGGLTTLYTMRATPGWNFRPEGITLLSAKYA